MFQVVPFSASVIKTPDVKPGMAAMLREPPQNAVFSVARCGYDFRLNAN
jgi:hypothetical protein